MMICYGASWGRLLAEGGTVAFGFVNLIKDGVKLYCGGFGEGATTISLTLQLIEMLSNLVAALVSYSALSSVISHSDYNSFFELVEYRGWRLSNETASQLGLGIPLILDLLGLANAHGFLSSNLALEGVDRFETVDTVMAILTAANLLMRWQVGCRRAPRSEPTPVGVMNPVSSHGAVALALTNVCPDNSVTPIAPAA